MRQFTIFILLLILLTACGGDADESPTSAPPVENTPVVESAEPTAQSQETTPTEPAAQPTEAVESAEEVQQTEAVPTAETADTTPSENSEPIDTTTLDVCALLPEADVAAITGPLRNAPEAAESIGDERGCTYLTEEGHIYSVFIVPLDRWEIATAVFTDAEPVPDLGDQALIRQLGGDTNLYVLVENKAMVQVYNTTSDTDISIQLAQLAIDILNS